MANSKQDFMNGEEEQDEIIVYKREVRANVPENEDRDPGNDLWDDTELIQAYNKAVGLAYDAVSGKGPNPGSSKGTDPNSSDVATRKKLRKQRTKKGKGKVWAVGDLCMAAYSADGEHYEAKIKSLEKGGLCTVEYLGYGETEMVDVGSLQPINVAPSGSLDNSIPDDSTIEEDTAQASVTSDWISHPPQFGRNQLQQSQIPVLPPPPPPNWLSSVSRAPSDQEALSSMLMSWYMSGYHTGYYQALREVRGNLHYNAENSGQKGVQSNRRREES